MKLAYLFFLFPLVANATDLSTLNAEQEARYRILTQETRCLVCQNQTIADSEAPLAADLREQVKTQIAAGRSNSEIKQYLTDRYGDFVLYKPPFKLSTALLWLGPFVLVALALVIAFLRTRRVRADQMQATPDPERLKKFLDENK